MKCLSFDKLTNIFFKSHPLHQNMTRIYTKTHKYPNTFSRQTNWHQQYKNFVQAREGSVRENWTKWNRYILFHVGTLVGNMAYTSLSCRNLIFSDGILLEKHLKLGMPHVTTIGSKGEISIRIIFWTWASPLGSLLLISWRGFRLHSTCISWLSVTSHHIYFQ